jgi:hypothetical protein
VGGAEEHEGGVDGLGAAHPFDPREGHILPIAYLWCKGTSINLLKIISYEIIRPVIMANGKHDTVKVGSTENIKAALSTCETGTRSSSRLRSGIGTGMVLAESAPRMASMAWRMVYTSKASEVRIRARNPRVGKEASRQETFAANLSSTNINGEGPGALAGGLSWSTSSCGSAAAINGEGLDSGSASVLARSPSCGGSGIAR